MLTGLSVLFGFALDFLFGDPAFLPHPVVLMGRCIDRMEPALRRRFGVGERGERKAGLVLAVVLPLGTLLVSGLLCWAAYAIHPLFYLCLSSFWCAQCLAQKGLKTASRSVARRVDDGDLDGARQAAGQIVGRDTDALDREGVLRAAVETTAENFSDGVAAPLFYMLLGGAPLALAYKAVNTLDSMVGYKNERYLWFGRASAKLDDAVNWLPSRIAALFFILAAFLTGDDGRAAWTIWRRDRRKHLSPNSAQTESACAGALGIRLNGPLTYGGQMVEKPWIGNDTRPVESGDVDRTNTMMEAAGWLCLFAGLLVRTLIAAAILY